MSMAMPSTAELAGITRHAVQQRPLGHELGVAATLCTPLVISVMRMGCEPGERLSEEEHARMIGGHCCLQCLDGIAPADATLPASPAECRDVDDAIGQRGVAGERRDQLDPVVGAARVDDVPAGTRGLEVRPEPDVDHVLALAGQPSGEQVDEPGTVTDDHRGAAARRRVPTAADRCHGAWRTRC
jgi:hypothetical protein